MAVVGRRRMQRCQAWCRCRRRNRRSAAAGSRAVNSWNCRADSRHTTPCGTRLQGSGQRLVLTETRIGEHVETPAGLFEHAAVAQPNEVFAGNALRSQVARPENAGLADEFQGGDVRVDPWWALLQNAHRNTPGASGGCLTCGLHSWKPGPPATRPLVDPPAANNPTSSDGRTPMWYRPSIVRLFPFSRASRRRAARARWREMPACTGYVEPLETRTLLSTFVVTNTGDAGAGSLR